VVAIFRRRTSPGGSADDAIDPGLRAPTLDHQAFAALYQGYFEPIYRYCYARLGNQQRAEDAAHQVFVRALEAFDRYQDSGRAREWLFVIAHNVVANEATRRTASPLEGIDEMPDPAASPEVLALAAADSKALREAIARLPADQRRAIELRIAGMSGREVAAELGRSVDAVKMLQQRAIDRLRADLGGNRRGGRDGA
jgi:RNA polymerase sigma-70 factor, ECF subfamily